MKKILAGIAVLAVAAAAQADLLATWTFDAGESSVQMDPNGNAANIGQVTIGNLERIDTKINGTGAGQFTAATSWSANSGIGIPVAVNDGYEIAGAQLALTSGSAINGANSGPGFVQWSLGSTPVGTAWTVSRTSGNSDAPAVDVGTISAGNHSLYLFASGTTSVTGGTLGSGGVRLWGSMNMEGSVQEATSVPEPATMSLLGLGALAMVIRRKLRK